MKPEFHAEYNPDIIYFLPAICWMRVETEDSNPIGSVLQIHWLSMTAQWLWESNQNEK